MAYAVFNIISTGSDLNAGSTTANSALVTDVGGTYNQGTGAGGTDRYTASSGTPFSATAVGEYASVYTAGATVATFIGQITAVNAGGASIDISLTIVYGTRPANASTKTAKTGGAWASFAVCGGLGSPTVPQPTQVRVKAATYTLTGTLNLGVKGTGPFPLWYRGYNTTVGDLDNGSTTLPYPTIDAGSNTLAFFAPNTLVSGLSFTSSRAGPTVTISSAVITFAHCRLANTGANSAAAALAIGGTANTTWIGCYFSTPSTANQIVTAGSNATYSGCVFAGAASGSTQVGIVQSGFIPVLHCCTFNGTGSHGVTVGNNGSVLAFGCTFNGCGGDAIRLTATPNNSSAVVNCAFFGSGGYDIDNASGANLSNVILANNLSYLPTSGHLFGFGDWSELNPLVDGSDPRTSSTDLHLISTSAGAGAGIPGQWENLTSTLQSTPDVGAWQRAVGAGGGGGYRRSRVVNAGA